MGRFLAASAATRPDYCAGDSLPVAGGGGPGHLRGNLLNRRRHRSLEAGGGTFSTRKVEKTVGRRSFAGSQVRMTAVMSREKSPPGAVLEGLGNFV